MITRMSTEGLCSAILLDKSDPTRLTYREIKDSWGTCANFVRSYGLKDYDPDQIEEALSISRALKEAKIEDEKEESASGGGGGGGR